MSDLTLRGRRFSLVFRAFDEAHLRVVQSELHLFCQGQHPAYDGKNKTKKPPPMSGEKGSRDLRLIDTNIGRLDRAGGRLEFAMRAAGDAPKTARPGEVLTVAAEAFADDTDGAGVDFRPTVYNFSHPEYYEVYAGLQHQVLDGANTAAIIDDQQYWQDRGGQPDAGKLLLVDFAQGLAETKVHHIIFDGVSDCTDVRDVVTGEPISPSVAEGLFVQRVNFVQAAQDPEYFVKAVEACESQFTQKMVDSRRAGEAPAEAAMAEELGEGRLPPKEYLYRNVLPALLPALEACQRDRPADPIEFIAFYMLRHSKQYSKTLKA